MLDRGGVPFSTGSMSHIHFVGGEKGGVGKSVVARLLAQRFIDRSVAFAAIDGDRSSGALHGAHRVETGPNKCEATVCLPIVRSGLGPGKHWPAVGPTRPLRLGR